MIHQFPYTLISLHHLKFCRGTLNWHSKQPTDILSKKDNPLFFFRKRTISHKIKIIKNLQKYRYKKQKLANFIL